MEANEKLIATFSSGVGKEASVVQEKKTPRTKSANRQQTREGANRRLDRSLGESRAQGSIKNISDRRGE